MDTDVAYYRLHEIELAFDALVDRVNALCDCVEQRHCPIWHLRESASPTAWLRQALLDMWYEQGQDGRATRNYIGMVLCDDAVLEHVAALNAAKDHFGGLVNTMRKEATDQIGALKTHLPRRHPALNQLMAQQGLARLHLKQAWRRIPVAEAPLARMQMSWYSSGRSIKRTTIAEAEEKLAALNNEAPHVRIQWQKLAALPSDEVLAQVQQQAPVMRANLFFKEPLDDGRQRRALNMALPLFVPDDGSGRLPKMNAPALAPPETRTRVRRGDNRLEDAPYIPSLRLYRYRY
ncbi:DNA replication terminus site-binding protein [Larsenimonas salina]|uniref:DNA replication terminus site-binding protein n=1 Tax=Larsenimonas salina TaxID=1295565 RepID=UPI002072EF8E|nr:DNA replication terminus site-binding protein [Larsenimonas salina]MCM5703205.1 DNA replication terminus site-binding protein [Larsenimonas salina]